MRRKVPEGSSGGAWRARPAHPYTGGRCQLAPAAPRDTACAPQGRSISESLRRRHPLSREKRHQTGSHFLTPLGRQVSHRRADASQDLVSDLHHLKPSVKNNSACPISCTFPPFPGFTILLECPASRRLLQRHLTRESPPRCGS